MTPHRSLGQIQLLNLAGCASHPEGRGLYGGFPTPAQPTVLLKGTDVFEQMAGGRVPGTSDEITARSRKVLKAREVVKLSVGDVYVSVQAGGAGYGDPLDRDPGLVLRDYVNGACSLDTCHRVYGVLIDPDGKAVREEETAAFRDQLRGARISRPAAGQPSDAAGRGAATAVLAVGDAVYLTTTDGGATWCCRRCGTELGSADEDFRRLGSARELPIDSYSRWNSFGWTDLFVLRETSCPACGHLLEVQSRRKQDAMLYDAIDWRATVNFQHREEFQP
jgi:hypothetical protein